MCGFEDICIISHFYAYLEKCIEIDGEEDMF